MADNQFKVILGADATQLQKALSDTLKQVQEFANRVSKVPQVAFATQGIDNYRKSVAQLKTEIATVKFTQVVQGLTDVNAATGKLNPANVISLSNGIEVLANKITAAVGNITIGSDSLLQLTSAVNQAGAASIAAGQGFLALGTKVPTQQIQSLTTNVAQLKADLAGGFKPIVNFVDPKIPVLLNSLNASLANFSPIAAQASLAAVNAGKAFQSLGPRLPLADINTLKNAVAKLKADLATGGKTFSIDTKGAVNSISFLENELKNLKDELKRATDPNAIIRLNKSLADTGARLKTLTASSGQAGKSLALIKPSANAASQSMLNFGRVIQDAPFGIMGIANNIDPLIQSFSQLKTSTGSTGGALKAMAASMAGPAGIAVGISALSSLLIVASQKYGSLTNAINAALEGTNALNEANREIGKAFAEAQGSVAGEIATIQSLLSIARDHTVSRKAQQEAIDKLNTEYDKYLPKLTTENINTQAVTTAVDNLTRSLVRQAKVRGLEALISKEAQKTAELMTGDLADQLDIWDALGASARNAFSGVVGASQSAMVTGQKNLNKELADSTKKTNVYTEALRKMLGEEAQAGTLVTPIESKGQDKILKALKNELDGVNNRIAVSNKLREAGKLAIFQETQALEDELKKLEILEQMDLRELQIGIKPKLEIDPNLTHLQIGELYQVYSDRTKAAFRIPIIVDPNVKVGPIGYFEKLEEAFKRQETLQKLGVDVPLQINILPESNITQVFDKIIDDIEGVSFEGAFKPMVDTLNAEAKKASASIENGITATFSESDIEDSLSGLFSSVGEGIGKSISEGTNPFVGAAEAFLNVIGSVVDQFGKRIVALGVAMLVAKQAIELSFKQPAVAIAAGIALSILGTALKNIKFTLPGAAEGGILSGPNSGFLAMLHGTEMVTPIDKVGDMMGSGGLTGEFVLVQRGEDLRYALSATNKRRGRS